MSTCRARCSGDRHCRDDVRRDRGRRAVGVSGAEDGARDALDPLAARRRRDPDQVGAPVLARRLAAGVRRADRCADPAGRGDDLDLRLLEARLFARRARPAAAQLRPAEPARARLAARDRLGRDRLVGDRRRHVVLPSRRRVPREPVLVRRPARVHRRTAGGDQAAHRGARPRRGRTERPSTSGFAAPRSRCRRSWARSAPSRSGSLALATHPARATQARSGSPSGWSSSSPSGTPTARGCWSA